MTYQIAHTFSVNASRITAGPSGFMSGMGYATLAIGFREPELINDETVSAAAFHFAEMMQRTVFISDSHPDVDDILALANFNIQIAFIEGVFPHGMASWIANELGSFFFDRGCAVDVFVQQLSIQIDDVTGTYIRT